MPSQNPTTALKINVNVRKEIINAREMVNGRDLRAKVMAGELKEPDFAFLEATVVADVFCVHLAAHKALTAAARGTLSSRSLHAELVFNVSGSKHVSTWA